MHNLKNISFEIPHNAITVVTGVSGSGKSTLAFDTIYAEGQRRYIESLSAYARQFLERIEKPDVDEISGIAPAIAIKQKNATRNPRSTVATATEIYDYLRLLLRPRRPHFLHPLRRRNPSRHHRLHHLPRPRAPARPPLLRALSPGAPGTGGKRPARKSSAERPRPHRRSRPASSRPCSISRSADSIASTNPAGCTNSLPRKLCSMSISRSPST